MSVKITRMRSTLCAALLLTAACLPAALALDTGDVAPAMRAQALDGAAFDLASQKGKVVVVNLWATWCVPCRDEMPVLDTFYRKYRGRGVLVFGLSEDDRGDLDEVHKAMMPFAYPAALARDAQENGFRLPRALPVTYVIDREGVVRAKLWVGGTPVTEENLEKAVEPLLAPQK
jgi:cytochrome c biogenesis protein CcmG/thiol:disulfide interchange protein DsbE